MYSLTVLNELKNLHSQKIDSVPTSSAPCKTFLQSLPYHFVCSHHAGFFWMRTEVADNWFAEVDRFAASSLRMIFVGQRGCKRVLLISARGSAISWRNVNIIALFRRWSMFSSHDNHNFVALYVFPGLHFIAAWLLYLLCHKTISFGSRQACRHTCISVAIVASSKLEFSDSIFGKNNFPYFWLDGCIG